MHSPAPHPNRRSYFSESRQLSTAKPRVSIAQITTARIEQYFQVQGYALWDVIENGNSFKPAAQTTTNADGTSTTLIPGPVTTKEKYKDAKSLFAAIQTRFGGNEATKKTQKTLLKQMNKPNLDIMSFDDLYNNFKIIEQGVKRTASSSLSSQNMVFVSSPSSTNKDNTAYGVSTAYTQVSTASTQDLEQIHKDDLEEMDLKCLLALLSMRTRRFFQKNGRKITINGSDTAGYDKSKVECFNCHKMGHFARECRGPRNQDSRNKNQDSSRRTINVEETSSKAMVAIDGAGFDWSYMADDEVPTNMALMAFLDSEVYNDKTCLKTCLKSFETLKTQLEDLRIEFNKSEFNLATYKRGLASVEEQLVFYKKNEVIFYEQLAVLKRDISYKDSKISMLKSELEKLKQEKESNQLKIENFDNASKSLDKLIGSQITDKSRKGVGFPKFEGYGPKTSKSVSEDISNEVRESPDAPLVEELVSDDKLEKKTGHPQKEDQGYVDSGCSRHMTGNMSYLSDFKEFDGGYVTFRGGAKRGKITGKGTLKTVKLDFKDVYFVKELQFNLFSVSQMCDKKNSVLFTDTGCFVLSPDFKLADESQATLNESMLWHRRLGYVNFKTINKLVKENLVRGLPTKRFENDQTCVACLKSFITEVENQVDKKVKIIRCDNGTEFKNRVTSEFCEKKGIKKEFSIARTPQQNRVAERRNRTLIVAARTMLVDSKLPTTFWAESVNTACYVQNRVLVVKPHNKTPYELFRGRTPALSFMRPFGYHVTILNTLDYLGKFNRKSDEGFFVRYSMNSKAFRVYNIRTRKVEENLHIRFLEDKPIIAGDGPKWLFDIDVLTKSMNYVPVVAGTNSNDLVGTEESIGAGHSSKETGSSQDYILMPLWKDGSLFDSSLKNASNDEPQPSSDAGKKDDEGVNKESGIDDQERPENSTQDVNTVGPSINTASTNVNTGSLNINIVSPTVTTAPLEATHADFFGDETEVDMSNITTTYLVPSTPNTRIYKNSHLISCD
ncbi:ribonuclease H-like domain-containing protein [Tanacetum coccineum]|uniref:Ribonuclease H-like domain-containing protein n=1 Tax=Tanacetum coccineum TaxID=301880 RepID=A0ABQ4YBG4_9ASTR